MNKMIEVDARREFTDATWLLAVIMMDEDKLTPRQIAEQLRRDPKDGAAKIRQALKSGYIDDLRGQLMKRGGTYAMRKRAKAGVKGGATVS